MSSKTKKAMQNKCKNIGRTGSDENNRRVKRSQERTVAKGTSDLNIFYRVNYARGLEICFLNNYKYDPVRYKGKQSYTVKGHRHVFEQDV